MADRDPDAARIGGPAPGGVGLLIIDMINPMDFSGAEAMLPRIDALVATVLDLRRQADALGVPVVYVNDNYGQWHSERSKIIETCAAPDRPGREMIRRIAPRPDDYFVIKPQVSGFYATNLPVLLPKLGVRRLVLTGIAADICVLFTAADAHMRDYDLWIPPDAVAGEDERRAQWALAIMRQSLAAETRPTRELDLKRWMRRDEPEPGQER
ncbi:isochorismatase family cysteine hydrolase [Caulobacter sp. LARHSG274]